MKYKIIYADPPWDYNDKGCQGTATNHYKTMKNENICDLPIKSLADEDCILFVWATYPKLPEALEVIKAWGFKYKSIAFQWIKKNKKSNTNFYGLGRWTRGNTEPCLLATKGKPKKIAKNVFQIIESPVRKHSQKPDVTRQLILKLMGDLPRIELFARNRVEGWDVWGDEAPREYQMLLKGESEKCEK